MAFEAEVINEGKVVVLKDNFLETEAEIYCFGALLNGFSIAVDGVKQNVVSGFENTADAKNNITKTFKSAKLSPFVCRLKQGDYEFENKQYHINKFYLQKEAIHGLLYDAIFTVTNKGCDSNHAYATLEYAYNKKDEGFPFSYLASVTYSLEKNNRLSLTTKVTNTGNASMPLCDGWHPYFKLGETINDLQIKFNSNQIVDFDDKLLPTGRLDVYTNYQYFEHLGETFFDNCFVLNSFDKPACVIKDEVKGLSLQILCDASYPYLQIYTPKDCKSIAIENLSSMPDAFNNGMGLIILKPGETKTFTTAYQITPFV